MNPWLACGLVLAVTLAPVAWMGARQGPVDRLVALELAGAVVTVELLVLAQAFAQSSELIVPLVLALLSVAGTLAFTRLLGPRP